MVANQDAKYVCSFNGSERRIKRVHKVWLEFLHEQEHALVIPKKVGHWAAHLGGYGVLQPSLDAWQDIGTPAF